MEATVVSVGKAVLDGALGYAKSKAAAEVALQLGVDRDVAFITDELEMMQSFLMTADEEQDQHKLFTTWVKQVRDLAYNVEDSLMDFGLHCDKSGCLWFDPRALWQRRIIAMEVKKLRAKVEDVSSRNLRYRLIKDGSASSKPTTDMEQASVSAAAMFGISEANHAAKEQAKVKVELLQLITSTEKELRVIAVWGSGSDLGKMTTIRESYDNQKIHKEFQCRAWVQLMRPFNPNKFFEDLVRQFCVYSHEVAGKTKEGNIPGYDVFKELEKMGQSCFADEFAIHVNKRYLIVLDGLSSIAEWDWIKTYFPDKKNGSRIIVSTQQVEIATLCTEKPYQVTMLKQLSSEQAIYMFHKFMPKSDTVNKTTSISAVVNTNGRNIALCNKEILEEVEGPNDAVGDKVFISTAEKKFDRTRTMALVDPVLVGRATDEDVVTNLIGQPNSELRCKVISVWGMGGIGKTTLVQSVYRSQKLGGWKRAWVTALRPFNLEALVRSLTMQLLKDVQKDPIAATTGVQKEKIKEMGLEELRRELTLLLDKQMCLIVLDDILSTTEWDLIMKFLEKAGRIVVTTREKIIAKHCSGDDKNMHSLEGLTAIAALNLFKKKVFKDNSEKIELHPDMLEQASLILRKCDGLPLAISTIGGFLSSRPQTAIEWRKLNDRINSELDINPELKSIKTVLKRSYDGLPYHLKSCFLYLSIFPEDHIIRRSRMVRRWIAEGYSRETHEIVAEEVGDRYFDDLFDRSMILPGEGQNHSIGKFGSCQLHDIMRDISISKAREENLVFTLNKGTSSFSSTQGSIRHLVIGSDWKRDKDVLESRLDFSHVRSLTVFGEWKSFLISKNMMFLRVLDLEDTSELHDHDLNKIGKLLHLRYLSLRGCGWIRHLPGSFGNLGQLQTLDIRGTRIQSLPKNIIKLHNLHCVRAGEKGMYYITAGVNVPRMMRKLCNLHALGIINVGKGKAIIKELSQLTELHKLGVSSILKDNCKEFWAAISGHSQLRSVSVYSKFINNTLDYCLGECLTPPKCLEVLKLSGKLDRVTDWIHHLQNILKLKLKLAQLEQGGIDAIGMLPNLVVLRLLFSSVGRDVKQLQFQGSSFPSLVVLELDELHSIQSVEFKEEAMPKLELLQADWCFDLLEISGLRFLTSLKEIRLDNEFHMELKDNVESQLAGYPNNVSLKLV